MVSSDKTSFLSKPMDVDYAGLKKTEVRKLKLILNKII